MLLNCGVGEDSWESLGLQGDPISPSNEYSGFISFRLIGLIFLLDPLDQGTLKSLLQHHNSKGSILRCSAFFILQLSHPYMTMEKNVVLIRRTFVGKVMSLLFNMLSRLVIAYFMAAVTICSDFGAHEIKVCHCFHVFPLLFVMKWWDQMPWS